MNASKYLTKLLVLGIAVLFFGMGFWTRASLNANTEKTETTQPQDNFSKQEKTAAKMTRKNYLAAIENLRTLTPANYKYDEENSYQRFEYNAADEVLAFGSRNLLTLTGEVTIKEDTATERVVRFADGTKIFSVALIWLDESIGNDFLGSDWLFGDLGHANCIPFLMSYKNILLLTTLQDTKPVDAAEAYELSEVIVQLIKNY